MLDIGGGELLVIGIVALVVIGPKELPGLLRTAGNAMNKVRRMAAEFRGQFDDAMREAELDQAKKAFTDATDMAQSIKPSFNPLDTIRNEIQSVKDEIKGGKETSAPPPPVETKIDLPPPPSPPAVEIRSEPVALNPTEASPSSTETPQVASEAKPKRSRKKPDAIKDPAA